MYLYLCIYLDLEDYPLENLKALPLFPSHKRQLQVCQGKRCSGHADSLHKLTVSRLDSGDAALILSLPDGQLKGGLETVDTPVSCLPIHNRLTHFNYYSLYLYYFFIIFYLFYSYRFYYHILIYKTYMYVTGEILR